MKVGGFKLIFQRRFIQRNFKLLKATKDHTYLGEACKQMGQKGRRYTRTY